MVEFKKDDFEIIGCENSDADAINRPNISYWQDAWRRLKKNKLAMGALVVLIFMCIMMIVGPYMTGKEIYAKNTKLINLEPNSEYWWGCDALGRDLFSRVWIGGRISIIIGLVATALQVIVGCAVGGIMAYFGGWVDEIIMRIIEIISSVPGLLITILIMMILGRSMGALLVALTVTAWIGTARMVRGQLMQLRESEYVLAAQVLGASPTRIITKHLIPNTIGLLILNTCSSVPGYIFQEAGLSFIGIGIQAPTISWGLLISDGREVMAFYPHQLFYPALALCITVLSINILGDGLTEALDPKLRQ